MQPSSCRRMRCGVCGFSEVRTDEVVDRSLVFLAECPRCEYRWTSASPLGLAAAGPGRAPARRPFRVTREVAPAA